MAARITIERSLRDLCSKYDPHAWENCMMKSTGKQRRPRRKDVWMLLRVSTPPGTTARDARREVRSLVNDQCNYSLDPGDVKVRVLRSVSGGAR